MNCIDDIVISNDAFFDISIVFHIYIQMRKKSSYTALFNKTRYLKCLCLFSENCAF